jgi:hypothetical protein
VELVDTHALGACAFGREGSSPFSRTTKTVIHLDGFFRAFPLKTKEDEVIFG